MKLNLKIRLFQIIIGLIIFQLTIFSAFARADSLEVVTKTHQPIYKTAIFKTGAVPFVLVTSGVLSIDKFRYTVKEKRDEKYPDFENKADDYIQYTPIAATYLISMVTETKNDFINKTLLLAKSELLGGIIVHSFKRTSGMNRPDGGKYAFPSGHTTQSFVAATFMHKELGDKNILYSIVAYSAATSVGVLRIMNNRHWISDVLVGAGVGILSTNLVYLTHQYRWGNKTKKQITLLPTYSNGTGGIFFAYTF